MTDKLPTTTYIYVDRRKTGKGKSSGNRQRLLDRIKDTIRSAKPDDIASGGVKGTSPGFSNPVRVARDALHEPTFHYALRSGVNEIIFIGNDQWERGDEWQIQYDEGGGGGAGQGGGGEDDFIINISRDEFLNIFFEDCELPDMHETSERVIPETVQKPAGYQKDGTAARLSVIRSYRNSLGRRNALIGRDKTELEELEEELVGLEEALATDPPHPPAVMRAGEITVRITELKQKISSVPFFEKFDLRYRRSEKVDIKQADAVLFLLMDISGSMDEDKKTIARKLFSLQYAFIRKRYPQTDVIFIAHTDDAEEMTEEDFFSTRKSGGTTVSSSLVLAHSIIKQRYDPDKTNIYLSYAGDGDNWPMDNQVVLSELEDNGLLSKLRHAVYSQVGVGYSWNTGSDSLWNVMSSVSNTTHKLDLLKIRTDDEVFPAFRKVYANRKSGK